MALKDRDCLQPGNEQCFNGLANMPTIAMNFNMGTV